MGRGEPKLYKRGMRYWMRWYDGARTRTLSLQTIHPGVAKERFEKQRRLLHDSGPLVAVKAATIDEWAKAYWTVAESTKRPQTVALELVVWTAFAASLDSRKFAAVTRQAIERHVASLDVKPTTRNVHLRCLKAILSRAVKDGYLSANPAKGIPLQKVQETRLRFLSAEEIAAVLAAAEAHSPEAHMLFALSIYAGLRKAEVVAARWEWIRDGLIHVEGDEEFQTKSYRSRAIPISKALAAILDRNRSQNATGWILRPARAGKRYRYEYRCVFEVVCKRAGVSGVTPHVLRHTFASQLAIAGVSLYKISTWLGHADLKTTMIYAHLQAHDDDINRIGGPQ